MLKTLPLNEVIDDWKVFLRLTTSEKDIKRIKDIFYIIQKISNLLVQSCRLNQEIKL